jgi:hypothetical protein
MNEEDIRSLVRHRIQQAKESLREASVLLETNCSSRGVVNRSSLEFDCRFRINEPRP